MLAEGRLPSKNSSEHGRRGPEGVGRIFFPRKKTPEEATRWTHSHRLRRPPTRRPPPTARSGSCQQEGDAPTIQACSSLYHMLVIEKCDVRVPWRRPKAPPLPLPPPKPLPSRQWQPTHQLTHRHLWASGGSHPSPPFQVTCDPECAADSEWIIMMSTAALNTAQETNGDLAGSWLWEAPPPFEYLVRTGCPQGGRVPFGWFYH